MKLALLQLEAACGKPELNLGMIERAMVEASDQGAYLLVTPELAMTGYGAGDAMHDLAQPANGPWFNRLRALAQQTGLTVVAGFPERGEDGIYNSAMVVDGMSDAPAVYRKSHLYGGYEKGLFRAPAPQSIFTTACGLKCGLLICYDVEFPENTRRLARAGADIILVPTALPQSDHAAFIAEKMVAVRAFENQVFIAYANHAGADERFAYAGLSHIAAPDGTSLALAPADKAALIVVEIDQAAYTRSRQENTYLADLGVKA